jgi:hypothetical protein
MIGHFGLDTLKARVSTYDFFLILIKFNLYQKDASIYSLMGNFFLRMGIKE